MTKWDTLMCDPPIPKVKNYNLNLTEVRDSDLKKCLSRNFQFNRRDPKRDFIGFKGIPGVILGRTMDR